MKEINDRRFPIGNFEYGKTYSIDDTRKQIKTIARLPKDVKKLLKKLRDGALDKSYRIGGWTARQIIHHLADSSMNAYIRFKMAATENTPVIKPYEEQLWADTEDGKHGSPKTSLKLLSALHIRWVDFLMSLSDDELDRGYYHPASKRTVTLREAIALYAWHSTHHLEHLKIVADGNFEKASEAKKSAFIAAPITKGRPKGSAKGVETKAAPQKRVMSEAHKDKIRAAQQARAAKKAGTPAAASSSVTPSEPKKRGRKPGVKPVAPQASVGTSKRIRRSSAEVAAEKAAKAAQPKLSRAEVLAIARAARISKAPAAAPKVAAAPGKRGRKPNPEIAAAKAAKAAKPKLSRAEVMEKARAAAAANRAAKADAKPSKAVENKSKRNRRSAEEIAAAKAAKTAQPKLSRKEVMEKARAAAAANRAAKAATAPPKAVENKSKRNRRSAEEIAAAKAAKAAQPKLSRKEVMEKARAAAAANRASKGILPKPKKDPNAPKLSREEVLAKARAARQAKKQ